MATNVGELEATLRLRDELSARLKEVDGALQKSGQSFEGVGAKAKGFGGITEGVVGTLTKVGAAFGLAFGAQKIVGAITNLGQLGSELTDMSARTGIGVVELQKLGAVAEASGSSMEELGNGIQGMARKLATGDEAAVNAVRMLGLEVDDLVAMNPDQAFFAIADAAAAIHNPMERTALLTDLGGKAFEKLSPTIANVRTELEGVTTYMDAETIATLDAFDDKLGEFGRAWDVFLAKFALPVVQAATVSLDWLIVKFGELEAAGKKAASGNLWAGFQAGPAQFGQALAIQLGLVNDAVDTTTQHVDLFGEAFDALGPKVDATTDTFDRGQAMLKIYREDAAYPLTQAEKALIVELDKAGISLSKIADAIHAPEAAIKLYLQSLKDATAAQKEMDASNKALAKTLDELGLTFKKLGADVTFAQTMQTNQATIEKFMDTLDTLSSTGEYKLLPPEQLGEITAVDQAFQQLQVSLEAAGASVVSQAAAWRDYNTAILQIQGGLEQVTVANDRISTSFGEVRRQFRETQAAFKMAVPADWDWSETYKNSPYYKPYDISGGWSSRNAMEQERQKAINPVGPSGPWGGYTQSGTGAGWGGAVNVNVNATNSLYLPSNQQQLGELVSSAVVAQLKAMGVKVGSA